MAKSYYVDWEDGDYPTIRHIRHAQDSDEPLTLGQARAAIRGRARNEIAHWKAIVKQAATVTAEELGIDAGDD